MQALTENSRIVRHSNAVAAGTSDIEPTNGVDTAGARSVTFVVAFGAIVTDAVTSVKLQHSSVVNGSGDAFTDIAGTTVTVADDDDNGVAVVELVNPTKRFVRCVVDRGTQNATVDSIIAILHGHGTVPVEQDGAIGHVLKVA